MAAAPRRVAGDRAQLHLRHHRQPEGGGLPPPRGLPQRAQQRDRLADGGAPGLPVDPADVPLQRLVLSVDDRGARGNQRVPAPGGGGSHLRRHRGPWSDSLLRRSDRAQLHPERARGGETRLRPRGRDHDRGRPSSRGGARRDGAPRLPHDARVRPDRDLRPRRHLRLETGVERAACAGAGRAQGPPGGALPRAGRARSDGSRDHAPGAARRSHDRRGHVPGQHRDEGVSRQSEGDGRRARGRLVPLRRPRGHASGRLRAAQGPPQGHHHLRRREHLLDRGRRRALPPPRGAGSGSGGPSRRDLGRDALRLRDAQGGRERGSERHHRVLPRSTWRTSRRRSR